MRPAFVTPVLLAFTLAGCMTSGQLPPAAAARIVDDDTAMVGLTCSTEQDDKDVASWKAACAAGPVDACGAWAAQLDGLRKRLAEACEQAKQSLAPAQVVAAGATPFTPPGIAAGAFGPPMMLMMPAPTPMPFAPAPVVPAH
jgi:hypothetical protein